MVPTSLGWLHVSRWCLPLERWSGRRPALLPRILAGRDTVRAGHVVRGPGPAGIVRPLVLVLVLESAAPAPALVTGGRHGPTGL